MSKKKHKTNSVKLIGRLERKSPLHEETSKNRALIMCDLHVESWSNKSASDILSNQFTVYAYNNIADIINGAPIKSTLSINGTILSVQGRVVVFAFYVKVLDEVKVYSLESVEAFLDE